MIQCDYSKELRRKLAEGKTLDNALAELRGEGVSIVKCIGAVKKFRDYDLAEAKRIFDASRVKIHYSLDEIHRMPHQFHIETPGKGKDGKKTD